MTTTQATHTPTPWVLIGRKIRGAYHSGGVVAATPTIYEGGVMDWVNNGPLIVTAVNEYDANRAKLAAFDTLLDAAKAAIPILRSSADSTEYFGPGELGEQCEAAERALRAAIRTAEEAGK